MEGKNLGDHNINEEYIIEETYLSNHKNFVKVNNLHYGGFQRWFYRDNLRSKFWADRSCGVIAAANALYHMARYKLGFENLYRYSNAARAFFIRFADELYDYIKPTIIGVPSLKKLNKGVERFAKTRDIDIESEVLSMPKDMETTVSFIKEGLNQNSPVLMLTWNSNIKNLRYHWVTITGYYQTNEEKNYIITSNWGRKEIFSLEDWLNDGSYYRGLIYFH